MFFSHSNTNNSVWKVGNELSDKKIFGPYWSIPLIFCLNTLKIAIKQEIHKSGYFLVTWRPYEGHIMVCWAIAIVFCCRIFFVIFKSFCLGQWPSISQHEVIAITRYERSVIFECTRKYKLIYLQEPVVTRKNWITAWNQGMSVLACS